MAGGGEATSSPTVEDGAGCVVWVFGDRPRVLMIGHVGNTCSFASRANWLRSASLLPEATRPGFLAVAGFVFGTSEVTRSGVLAVVGAAVSSEMVSSGCASIVCIYKNLKTCKIPIRFLPDYLSTSSNPSSGYLRCLCLGVWEVASLAGVHAHRFQALFRTLCVL